MPRSRNPLRIVETFTPDPARCAAALLRLLAWEPQPADTADTAADPGEAGEDLRTSTSEEENPCADRADPQEQR